MVFQRYRLYALGPRGFATSSWVAVVAYRATGLLHGRTSLTSAAIPAITDSCAPNCCSPSM